MAAPTWFLREFTRKVFRDAKSSGKTVEAILDALSDAALEASNEDSGSGKMTTGSPPQKEIATPGKLYLKQVDTSSRSSLSIQ